MIFNFILTVLLFFPAILFPKENLKITLAADKAINPQIKYENVSWDKIKVVVTDAGKPVSGLEQKDFIIKTDLTTCAIKKVEPLLQTENARVSMILAIDNSSSMQNYVALLKQTLDDLLNHIGPSVKIGCVFFSEGFGGDNNLGIEPIENIKLYNLTADKEASRAAFVRHLNNANLSNRTYLFDELATAVRLAGKIDPDDDRYVVILSDGIDNASKNDKENVLELVAQNPGLVFYTIDYLTQTNAFLKELAENSGGQYFRARKIEELSTIFANISKDIVLLSGYLVSYEIPKAYLIGRVETRTTCNPLLQSNIALFPLAQRNLRTDVDVDIKGIFLAQVEFPFDWRVLASAPGYVADSVDVFVVKDSVYITDFDLKPATIDLTGRVTDSGTAPLAEAQVTVTELGSGTNLLAGITDSLGLYNFVATIGTKLLIAATKPGYTYGSLELPEVEYTTQLADIVLGLTAEGFVSEFRFLFEFNSDKLNTADISTLTQLKGCLDFVLRELEKSPTRMVKLVGWTDNIGGADYNLDLSRRRAVYIKNYLMEQGIDAGRIFAEGSGISEKYDNSNDEGRASNRRTDVIFFDQQPLSEKN